MMHSIPSDLRSPASVFAGLALGALLLAAPLGVLAADMEDESTTKGSSPVVRLEVWPRTLRLDNSRDKQGFMVLATDEDGCSTEVTEAAHLQLKEPLAIVDGHVLRPLADGRTQLMVEFGGQRVEAPLEVTHSGLRPELTFGLDVMPIFTAAGCNAGGCHGKASGQDGFRLSLFGFDPGGDHSRLTLEQPGRRINVAFPDSSLMLEKACLAVPHTGGKRIEHGGIDYQVLREWIASGAPADPGELARVTHIELYPPELLLRGPQQSLQLSVRAFYSDGTDRDVTNLARLLTNNPLTASLDGDGVLTSGAPGEAFITAGFAAGTVGIPIIVLPEESASAYEDSAETVWPANYIDELIEIKLRKLRVSPSELCDDSTFLRRIHLDIIGLLPSPADRAEFLSDPDPGKRVRWVSRLLERKEFAELWVMKWAEILQIRSSNQLSAKAALLYFEWVQQCIAGDMPVNEMVRRILGATGSTFSDPATNFYQVEQDNLVLAENAAQAFLGIRMQCAQCHNHPFDRWTQDDYYGFAAFFAQVGRKRAEDPRDTIIFDRRRGEVNHPVGGRTVAPKFLGAEEPDLGRQDRREVLAEWLTSAENPWFASSISNRLWSHFMGRGLVEEVDDSRVSNPASNGPLLDALAEHLVEYDFDVKQLVRDICTSRAYQRSTATNASNVADLNGHSHAQLRRLRSETLLDIICQVTEMPEKLAGLPLGSRAVQIADGATSNYFLSTFGRSSREEVDACSVSLVPTLSQALHLLNGNTLNQKITRSPLIPGLLADGMNPEEILVELYTRCLTRPPTAVELAHLKEFLPSDSDPRPALEDAFWAILNSREFLFLR
ncbi:MAG: hypothetical protein ACI8QS_002960 [Planctomycetota bacterium]|jgi:hypothetical protein